MGLHTPPLDPELMKKMVAYVGDMPAKQRQDMTSRAVGLIRFLDETLGKQKIPDRASLLTSFEFRMEALSRLRERPEYRAWAKQAKKEGDPDLVNEVMFDTAATEPLIEVSDRLEFDPASFFKNALARAEAEGKA
ncbi:hypothetical protein [Rhodoplanes sp. SY1]|uniref:hypothetical protein n=1 Tax=Rhodoplanes sp. SY1 TaxID=3166646 RepID=UPI0038B55C10